MNLKKYKPTFLSIICLTGIITGIPFGLYALTLTGGASLGGVVILWTVVGLVILFSTDRAFVSFVEPKKLSIIEFTITAVLLIISFTFYD